MRNILKSKKGISPILATLLLIVIAVAAIIVTYAWIVTYMSDTTSQAGELIVVEDVSFYTAGKINITVRNTGTADSEIVSIYIGTSDSSLVLQASVSPTLPQMISEGTAEVFSVDYSWIDGTRYYFKIFTRSGRELTFNRQP